MFRTFASNFMINRGNVLVFQDVLGHTNVEMTMRYTHFAPDHLTDALTLTHSITYSLPRHIF